MKRFVILLLFCFGITFAQENLISRTLDAEVWLASIEEGVAIYTPTVIGIARNLAALGLICALLMYFLRPSPIHLFTLFLRSLLVSGLLILTPQITTLTMDTTEGLRNWSMSQLQPTLDEGAAEFWQLGRDSGILMTTLTLPVAGLAGASAKSATALAYREAGVLASGIDGLLNFTVIPIAICVIIVHLMGLLALISVAVANVVFPIGAAMLMFSPANGEKYLGNYISTVLGAMLVVMFLPLAFRLGFDIIVVGPVQTINENFADFDELYQNGFNPPEAAPIDAQLQALYAAQDELVAQANDDNDPTLAFHPELLAQYTDLQAQIEGLQQERQQVTGVWYEQVLHTLSTLAQGLLAELRNWILRLVLLVIGSIIASYLIWRVSAVVAGLVGGVALEAVHFMAAPMSTLGSYSGKLQNSLRDTARSQESGKQLSSGSSTAPLPAGPSQGGGRA
ncbi:MAG: hypothetical protein ACRCYY_04660 [Trueperaceae bacterium]